MQEDLYGWVGWVGGRVRSCLHSETLSSCPLQYPLTRSFVAGTSPDPSFKVAFRMAPFDKSSACLLDEFVGMCRSDQVEVFCIITFPSY